MCPTGLAECKPRSRGSCSGTCDVVPVCGDGLLQPEGEDGIPNTIDDEECDDGNTANTDECDTYGTAPQSTGVCKETFC